MMNPKEYSEIFSNKLVDFKCCGNKFRFLLSHFLFSSFSIDNGSKLLLKTIARNTDLSKIYNIIDIGCGIGTLGICLSKINEHTTTFMVDRDALALLFTKANAQINKLKDIHISGSLGIDDITIKVFDLIVSNIPAKAGESVIEHIMLYPLNFLSSYGIVAIVIVKPLEELAKRILHKNNCNITFSESTKEYAVFHYNGNAGKYPVPEPEHNPDTTLRLYDHVEANRAYDRKEIYNLSPDNLLAPYFRSYNTFKSDDITYSLQTVYGIDEFDTLHFRSHIAITLLHNVKKGKKVLFYNPGQGHLPIIYCNYNNNKQTIFHFGSKDLLSLNISKYNLVHYGINASNIQLFHTPSVFDISGSYETIIFFLELGKNPFVEKNVLNKLAEILKNTGQIIIVGKSVYIQRILSGNNNLKLIQSHKHKGYRGVLLKIK